MIETSYLDTSSLEEQCEEAISVLETDNANLSIIETKLNEFLNNDFVQGDSITNLKQQMSDYILVIQTMKLANTVDIEDFKLLRRECFIKLELNGSIIFEQKNKVLFSNKYNSSIIQSYKEKSNQDYANDYYKNMSSYHSCLEIFDTNYIDIMDAKIALYDRIDTNTNSLFLEGIQIRHTVNNALNALLSAFNGTGYDEVTMSEKRYELLSCYVNRMVAVEDDGEIEIDWNEVRKVLSKESDEITDAEYNALAIAYLNAEEEEMGNFFQYMMSERKDYDANWFEYFCAPTLGDYSEFKISKEKVTQIYTRLSYLSDMQLAGMNEMQNISDKKFNELWNQRDSLLQRMALLQATVSGIDNIISQEEGLVIIGDIDEKYPDIQVIKGEDGSLKLSFIQFRNGEYGARPSRQESTITVHSTVKNIELVDVCTDFEERYLLNQICGYSLSSECMNFAAEQVAGEAIAQTSKIAAEQVANSMAKSFVENGVPFAGSLLSFTWGTYQDYVEKELNAISIGKSMEQIDIADVYAQFGMSANFVEYNISDGGIKKDYVIIKAHEGLTTSAKINEINDTFKYYKYKTEMLTYIPQVLTVEDIIYSSDDYMKWRDSLTNDEKIQLSSILN